MPRAYGRALIGRSQDAWEGPPRRKVAIDMSIRIYSGALVLGSQEQLFEFFWEYRDFYRNLGADWKIIAGSI
jgi:hypothetical protein